MGNTFTFGNSTQQRDKELCPSSTQLINSSTSLVTLVKIRIRSIKHKVEYVYFHQTL